MLLSESFCNLLRKSVSSLLDCRSGSVLLFAITESVVPNCYSQSMLLLFFVFVPIEHHHKRYAEAERV